MELIVKQTTTRQNLESKVDGMTLTATIEMREGKIISFNGNLNDGTMMLSFNNAEIAEGKRATTYNAIPTDKREVLTVIDKFVDSVIAEYSK
jgi:hypothetical protein